MLATGKPSPWSCCHIGKANSLQHVVGIEGSGTVIGGKETHHFTRSHGDVNPVALQHHANARRQGLRVRYRVQIEHADGTRRRLAVALKGFHGRGFPGTIGAEQGAYRSGGNAQVEPVYGNHITIWGGIPNNQVTNFNR